jgi:hypothetical protein
MGRILSEKGQKNASNICARHGGAVFTEKEPLPLVLNLQ